MMGPKDAFFKMLQTATTGKTGIGKLLQQFQAPRAPAPGALDAALRHHQQTPLSVIAADNQLPANALHTVPGFKPGQLLIVERGSDGFPNYGMTGTPMWDEAISRSETANLLHRAGMVDVPDLKRLDMPTELKDMPPLTLKPKP